MGCQNFVSMQTASHVIKTLLYQIVSRLKYFRKSHQVWCCLIWYLKRYPTTPPPPPFSRLNKIKADQQKWILTY